jgi:hypothetical protein
MDENSVLLIDEVVLPDRGAHKFETQLDLTMLTVFNAQARSRSQWISMLALLGFDMEDIVPYEHDAAESIIVGVKRKS